MCRVLRTYAISNGKLLPLLKQTKRIGCNRRRPLPQEQAGSRGWPWKRQRPEGEEQERRRRQRGRVPSGSQPLPPGPQLLNSDTGSSVGKDRSSGGLAGPGTVTSTKDREPLHPMPITGLSCPSVCPCFILFLSHGGQDVRWSHHRCSLQTRRAP